MEYLTEILSNLSLGFGVAISPVNLALVLAGCFFGTLIGALPGLGPVNGVAIVLPFAYTLGLEPASALMLLAGIYYGAEYGGRISSILLNIPGDAGAVMTAVDGHPLAQQGQAGLALALSAAASFVGSMVALVLLVLATPILANLALAFGPRDYVALLVFAFVCLARVSDARPAKTLAALALGLLLAMVGIDSGTGLFRFTFGLPNLFDGVDMLVVIIGLFAISEVFVLLERSIALPATALVQQPKQLLVDLIRFRWTLARGSLIGFFVGLLPGTGASIASTIAYGVEQRVGDVRRSAQSPETLPQEPAFGQGNLRGLLAPESANNGAAVGAMVPMLTLGLPGSGTTAVMLGALLMFNVTPGPLLFTSNPELAWGLIASMFVGNLFLLLLNLPLIGWFVRLLAVQRWLLVPLVVMLTFAGVYAMQGDRFDLLLMVGLGALAYALRKLGFPLVAVILGYVLGELFEVNLRRTLSISNGDWLALWQGPIAIGFWLLAVGVVGFGWFSNRMTRGAG